MAELPWVVRLARQAVELYVTQRKNLVPEAVPPEGQHPGAAFISLHTKDGALRGCIGTYLPARATLAQEVVHNAISAATRDPRFSPVRSEELGDLRYQVDILARPEPIASPEELHPQRYGVIVELGWRRGLLLPALEGVSTVAEQLAVACAKAGIAPEEPFKLYRFTVQRYTEPTGAEQESP